MDKEEFANKIMSECIKYIEEDKDNFDDMIVVLEATKQLFFFKQFIRDKRLW